MIWNISPETQERKRKWHCEQQAPFYDKTFLEQTSQHDVEYEHVLYKNGGTMLGFQMVWNGLDCLGFIEFIST